MQTWLLLHYTLPTNPSARRVYVWRKLKRLGAVLLNESVWVLPDTSRTAEQLQWLTAEIQEMKGNAYLWRSNLVMGESAESLMDQFMKQVDASYKALMKKIGKKNQDPAGLSREYQHIADRDYFNSELGKQVREKLLALRGGGDS
jgi:DNA-binding transcriptional regulator PaaX